MTAMVHPRRKTLHGTNKLGHGAIPSCIQDWQPTLNVLLFVYLADCIKRHYMPTTLIGILR